MSLLHPEFLLALAALAVPIIVHLFNFRRFKKIVFPNVRFLKEVDLRSRSKNKLKHLLVLFSRMLALACLVIAFSRPFIPAHKNEYVVSEKHVAIYLDNSFSMTLENEDGNLLAQSIEMAEDIAEAFSSNDRFLLLTNDLKAEHQRMLSIDEFKESLASIKESPTTRTYSEIYKRASDAFERRGTEGNKLFFISDFQEQVFDPINTSPKSSMSTSLIRLEHLGQGNVFIDSIWFESPVRNTHSPERLGVRVSNASGKDLFDIPLRLTIDGIQKSLGNMTLKSFSTVDSVLSFTNESTGWKRGRVSIDDYPITFDDEMYFSYEVKENHKIMIIGPSSYTQKVARIFSNDPFYEVETSGERQVDMSSLRNQDFIVLAGVKSVSSGQSRELSKFMENGGSVCILPPQDVNINAMNDLLLALNANTIIQLKSQATKVSSLDSDHPIYQDVFDQIPSNLDLPECNSYFSFVNRVQSSEERILSLQNDKSFLSAFSYGKGKAYVFASGLDDNQSTLSSHSIFITSLLRMAEMSTGTPPIFSDIGADSPISLRLKNKTADVVFSFIGEDGTSFIPEQRSQGSRTQFFERGQVENSGTYSVSWEGNEEALTSFNYDRMESRMEFISEKEAMDELERNGILDIDFIPTDNLKQGGMLSKSVAGTQLWRYFIIAALCFLALEVLLLKFWKS